MIKLFTDSDLDGLGCGVLTKLVYGEEASVTYCTYRNLNQRVDKFIENPDNEHVNVLITDLSVNEQVEKKLAKRHNEGKSIQVIDHHKTALHFNEYEWGAVKIEYDDGRLTCATSLLYDYYISKNLLEPTKATSEFIDLVRQYDTWEWDVNNNQLAKRLNDLFGMYGRDKLEQELIVRLQNNKDQFTLNENEELILEIEEKKIERYIQSKNRQLVQTMVDEYCVGIVHSEQYHSELGNALNKRNPHLDLITIVNDGTKKVGFRTIYDHVDVSEFAQRFGGGGHSKASGCELTQDAFEKFVLTSFTMPSIKPDPERNELNIKEADYGSRYINRKGEISVILPSNTTWEVIHVGKKLEESFDSYQSAENYIKRNYLSWLMFDNDLLYHLSSLLAMTENELRARYIEIMKTIRADQQLTHIDHAEGTFMES